MGHEHSREYSRLLPDPSRQQRAHLDALRATIATVAAVPERHRAALPRDIRRLSELLTCERDERPADYLSRPPFLSAYLHYFLPWNVYRQVRLLTGLNLDVRAGARIVDLGAGPLTFGIAFAIARLELRRLPLAYVAVDRAGRALTAGREILTAVLRRGETRAAGDPPAAMSDGEEASTTWGVHTLRSDVDSARIEPADLLVAANLVNEWRGGDGKENAARVITGFKHRLRNGGRILIVEPGTRGAARRLRALRTAAIELGLRPLAPCTHADECPLPARRTTGWCHFAPRSSGAPRWLHDLSRGAGLPKERAALSFLLLADAATARPHTGNRGDARVVSGPLDLPDKRYGHYVCRADGLAMVRVARGDTPLRPGDLVPEQDLRSAGQDRGGQRAMFDLARKNS